MSARMWLRAAGVALSVAAGVLAGCGGGGASLVPHSTGGGGSQQGNLAEGTLRIIIPQKTTNGKKRPAYVSPSTANLAWTLDGATQRTVPLITPSPCSGSPLSCTVNFYVAPGTHTFSFTLEDANFVPLSGVTGYTHTLLTGQANLVTVTLGGIANSFSVSSSNTNFATPASGSNQYTVYGTKAITLTINALDADGNIIVGAGSPSITATLAPVPSASPVPATLTAGSNNTWTLASTYAPTNPAISGVGSLVVSAAPYLGTGVASPPPATYNLQFYVPWLYVAQSGSGKVTTYDEQGNQQSVTISGLKSPSAVYFGAYSSGATPLPSPNTPTPAPSPYLYVGEVTTITPTPVPTPTASNKPGPNTYTGSIGTYNGDGTTPTITGSFPGVGVPAGLTFDTNLNYVYVLNSIGTALQAYDAQGNSTSVITSAPTISNPSGIAFDPVNDALYVSTSSGVSAYGESGVADVSVAAFGGVNTPTGIAYDSHLNEIAVLNQGSSTITLYAPAGGTALASFGVVSSPTAIAFDPYTQWFYVANATSIAAYSESGSLQTLSGGWPGLSTPSSITVVQ